MTAPVIDRRPPDAVVRVLNAGMRVALRSVVGRAIGGLAELEFEGRRTERRLRVVVGWHELDGRPVVLTPASWRANFDGGRTAAIWHRGHAEQWLGRLTTDPVVVAGLVNRLLGDGASPSSIGLRIADGHVVGPDDVVAVGRAAICFERD